MACQSRHMSQYPLAGGFIRGPQTSGMLHIVGGGHSQGRITLAVAAVAVLQIGNLLFYKL